jgi:V/A-type H+-transporting ATPase subunit C
VDCGYEDLSRFSAPEVEDAISRRRAEIFADIAARVPEKKLTEAFELKYDYHNVKVVLKSRAAGVDGEHMLSASGRVKAEALYEAYNTDDYRYLPGTLAAAMADARGILARTNNPQLADFRLDRAYFEELREAAASMSGSYLGEYAAVLIDGANLRSAVRTLRMGRGADFMKKRPGGGRQDQRRARSGCRLWPRAWPRSFPARSTPRPRRMATSASAADR